MIKVEAFFPKSKKEEQEATTKLIVIAGKLTRFGKLKNEIWKVEKTRFGKLKKYCWCGASSGNRYGW